ncbi:MAG: vWA domain-containing protein [Ferrimicrobium sp.]
MSTFQYRQRGPSEPIQLDASSILSEIQDSLAYHGNVAEALRELMQRGLDGEVGLAKLLERLRQRREQLLTRYDPNQTVQILRNELDAIINQERSARQQAFQATRDDAHRLAEMELDSLPNDLGQRLKRLQRYDFLNSASQERLEDLIERLRSSILQSQLTITKERLTETALAEMRQMTEALTDLVERYNRGEDVTEAYREFAQRYPEMTTGAETFEDLLERLASEASQLNALLNSLDPQERRDLMDLMEALLADEDVAQAMARLQQALENSSPFQHGLRYGFRGDAPIELGDLSEIFGTLGRLDDLEAELVQATTPDRLGHIDLDQASVLLGSDAKDALVNLSRVTETLRDAGLIGQSGQRMELTPSAIRTMGRSILDEIFPPNMRGTIGHHESRTTGWGTELAGETKHYEFGDPFRLALRETLDNALRHNGPGVPIRITLDDLAIETTESRTRCATVLALDLSLSMPLNDTFLPAKRVAFALSSLITSTFPRDYLSLITFSETAREVPLHELPTARWDYVYGTNIEHALLLARTSLRARPGHRQIFLVTDGEPTAHIDPATSEPFFSYPPTPETIQRTLAEVVRCTRDRIVINLFILNADRSLRAFADRIVSINHGKAFYPEGDKLGQVIVSDYLSQRSRLASH